MRQSKRQKLRGLDLRKNLPHEFMYMPDEVLEVIIDWKNVDLSDDRLVLKLAAQVTRSRFNQADIDYKILSEIMMKAFSIIDKSYPSAVDTAASEDTRMTEVLEYMNEKLRAHPKRRGFKAGPPRSKRYQLMAKRFVQGATVQEMKDVIDYIVDTRGIMWPYFRPETLFGQDNYQRYTADIDRLKAEEEEVDKHGSDWI